MSIEYINPFTQQHLTINDEGLTDTNNIVFPLINGAYRVVADNNYTENFGFQWNKFAGTQIAKVSNLGISKKRFLIKTRWEKEDLTGKNILKFG